MCVSQISFVVHAEFSSSDAVMNAVYMCTFCLCINHFCDSHNICGVSLVYDTNSLCCKPKLSTCRVVVNVAAAVIVFTCCILKSNKTQYHQWCFIHRIERLSPEKGIKGMVFESLLVKV